MITREEPLHLEELSLALLSERGVIHLEYGGKTLCGHEIYSHIEGYPAEAGCQRCWTSFNVRGSLEEEEHEEDELIDHPEHYGGADNPYEVIKVIEAWGLGFHLGNIVKYIARAGKKGSELDDLLKAHWYLSRQIERVESGEDVS